ncbi:MAG: DNA topoisomerase VI subunit B [Planctomycetes bacterium]|nr:DNA topoisomerase VI subunit B [Planctomycetota bacterium]
MFRPETTIRRPADEDPALAKSDTATPTLFEDDVTPKKRSKRAAKPRKGGDEASEPQSARAAGRRSDAAEMATKQREISVSEFFTKNRHLLGFDSPLKALLTAVKEAVDNSLDACEEAGILPEISVEITQTGEKTYLMAVEDNGPGIIDTQVGKVFGKLLYGSKFHKLSQSRGQQGIGISAAGMYGQLTTGKPVVIRSRTGKRKNAVGFTLSIDTARNKPEIHTQEVVEWDKDHGTRVEIDMEAKYQKGLRSVDMYLKQTAIANPHLTLHFTDPAGEKITYERGSKEMPPETVEIKPHPHGVELGRLIAMLKETTARSLSGFLQEEFSRVGPTVAKRIIAAAGKGLTEKSYPSRIAREEASALHKAIQETKISAPSTDCIAPIGEDLLLSGLKKEIEADFYVACVRPAAVYRGNPFQIEVGLAFGKPGGTGLELAESGRILKKDKSKVVTEDLVGNADEPIRVVRIANRVPLLYQQSGCAITKAVTQTNWRAYGLTHPRGALPIGPMAVMVHIASVWVPFTSESKEAIAAYPEILKEIKLGLQECGRKLGTYIRKGKRLKREYEKRSFIEKYIPHIGVALQEILELTDQERDSTVEELEDVLHKSRKF